MKISLVITEDSYVFVDPPDDLKLDTNYSLADEIRYV